MSSTVLCIAGGHCRKTLLGLAAAECPKPDDWQSCKGRDLTTGGVARAPPHCCPRATPTVRPLQPQSSPSDVRLWLCDTSSRTRPLPQPARGPRSVRPQRLAARLVRAPLVGRPLSERSQQLLLTFTTARAARGGARAGAAWQGKDFFVSLREGRAFCQGEVARAMRVARARARVWAVTGGTSGANCVLGPQRIWLSAPR